MEPEHHRLNAEPNLFDTPAQGALARTTDPETSHQAAESVTDLRDKQRHVLAALAALGPSTDHQLVEDYAMLDLAPQSPSGIRTRRRELTDAGLVRDTGERRQLASGRNAIVWATTHQRTTA